MRSAQNIEKLLDLPIDWMGLIFYEKSKRNVPNSAAASILEASDKKVKRVGVFVNEALEIVVQKIAKFKLSYVQLHGHESPDYCCLLYTSPSPRDRTRSRMPSSA